MSYPKFTKPTDFAKGGPKKNKKSSSGPKPNNPSLWARAKALAKSKFKVYPSAYANGWASKWYKEQGGTWSGGSKKAAGGSVYYQEGGPQAGDLMEIQNGGTHEESPLGGVPMGMNSDGQQVLVEEGETVQKETEPGVDFVFSDRIKITKQIAEEFKLPIRLVGKSFAEASKTVNNRSPRKNDPIDNFTKEREMSRLREAQEIFKERKIQEAIEMYGPPKGMEVEDEGEEMMEQEGPMMPPGMGPGIPPGMSPEMMGQQMPPEMMQGQPPMGMPPGPGMMAYGGYKMYQTADPILRGPLDANRANYFEESPMNMINTDILNNRNQANTLTPIEPLSINNLTVPQTPNIEGANMQIPYAYMPTENTGTTGELLENLKDMTLEDMITGGMMSSDPKTGELIFNDNNKLPRNPNITAENTLLPYLKDYKTNYTQPEVDKKAINKNLLEVARAAPVASNLLAAANMPPKFRAENYLLPKDSSIVEKPDIEPLLKDIRSMENIGRQAFSSRATSTGELLAGLSNLAAVGMAETGKARNQQYQDWIKQINQQQALNLQIAEVNSGIRQDVDSANAELQKQKFELINAAATEASKIADGMIQEGYTKEEMERLVEMYPYLKTYFSSKG